MQNTQVASYAPILPTIEEEPPRPPKLTVKEKEKLDPEPQPVFDCIFCAKNQIVLRKMTERSLITRHANSEEDQFLTEIVAYAILGGPSPDEAPSSKTVNLSHSGTGKRSTEDFFQPGEATTSRTAVGTTKDYSSSTSSLPQLSLQPQQRS